MNRRSACICFLAVVKTALLTSLGRAAEATAKTVARIAGPHWSVNGDWTPDLESVREHLRGAHQIDPGAMDLEAMLTLHDNVHNRMGSHGHTHARKPQMPAKGYAKF